MGQSLRQLGRKTSQGPGSPVEEFALELQAMGQ